MSTIRSPFEPNLFMLWQSLAVAQRKLGGFLSGDRNLSTIGHAREALAELKEARLEICSVEVRLQQELDSIDTATDNRLADVLDWVTNSEEKVDETKPSEDTPSIWDGLDSEAASDQLPWDDDEQARDRGTDRLDKF